jgi:serine/threonine protein kinase
LIDVLEKIHTHGVVHRDLKPENIILGTGKDSGKIYIIDFGISKIYRD